MNVFGEEWSRHKRVREIRNYLVEPVNYLTELLDYAAEPAVFPRVIGNYRAELVDYRMELMDYPAELAVYSKVIGNYRAEPAVFLQVIWNESPAGGQEVVRTCPPGGCSRRVEWVNFHPAR